MDDGSSQAIRLIRKRMDMTQAEVADGIGMSLRAYQDIENEVSTAKRFHVMALQLLSLREAVARQDIGLATEQSRRDALGYSNLVIGKP